jgi:hypothetical protein
MNRIVCGLAAVGILAGAGAPAFAQQPGMQMTPDQRAARFDQGDTDKDGKLTRAEWEAQLPEQMKAMAGQIWPMMDADGDGSVTKEQYVAFRPQRPG